MLVTELGILIVFNFLELLNNPSGNSFIEFDSSDKSILSNDVLEKA